MQTHDRVEVDQEQEKPRRGLLIGIAAAAAMVIGVLVLLQPFDDAPVAAEPPAEIATAFLEAYGSFDVDKAASYLAADADLLGFEGGQQNWRLANRWLEATGFKLLLDTCQEQTTSPAGTSVRCPFDYHSFRSDEIGLGPFSGSWFNLTVLNGEIVLASMQWGIEEFSPQVWEPFAEWVAETYPEDVAIMYTDSSQTMNLYTEESMSLWEQHSREYVAVAPERAEAEGIAAAFVEAYAAFDIDQATSYLAADAKLFGFLGDRDGLLADLRWREASGFKVLLDSCVATATAPSGTSVRCDYDYHGIRSDEIGLGPYSGSWYGVKVLDGEIVLVTDNIQFMSNGFSSEMWEPFALWIEETYPQDVTIMYVDSSLSLQQATEESAALWEQRSREYVELVGG